jgi:pancreatic triacylglycerol lipase
LDLFQEPPVTNIIVIDWGKGAEGLNYVVAARNSELVGRQVGNLLKAAMDLGVDPSRMHLIGHSLGAQIMNFAVGWVRQERPRFSVGRISGLKKNVQEIRH